MIYTISDGKYTVSVNDLGAELVSAKCGDFELIWRGEEYWKKHSPVLFPVCGRLKDKKYTLDGKEYEMEIHGFAKLNVFRLVEKTDTKLTLKIESNDETRRSYPFDFTFIAEYELSEGKLFFRTRVTNKSNSVMPYMFGWHPAFNFPEGTPALEELTMSFGGRTELNEHLPLVPGEEPKIKRVYLEDGKLNVDTKYLYEIDTIIFSAMGEKITLSNGKDYTLNFTWSANLPYLCIWKFADNGARFVCLEPWSNITRNNGSNENFNTRDLKRLSPGESENFQYSIEFVK